jgi:hypothetical protein
MWKPPKFTKQESELKSPLDKWLYVLNNLTKLKEICTSPQASISFTPKLYTRHHIFKKGFCLECMFALSITVRGQTPSGVINTLKYNGTPGSVIAVDATDDFKVAEVRVTVYDSTGALLEEGMAVQNAINTNLWKYTVSQENNSLAGSVVKAIAVDFPGNEASLEVTL